MNYVLYVFMYVSSYNQPTYVDTYEFQTKAECLAIRNHILNYQYLPTEAVCVGYDE